MRRSPRTRAAGATLAALLLAGAFAACRSTPEPPPGPVPVPGPPRPSVTWRSGVNGDPVIDRASVESFCRWRGRDCGVAHLYTDRRSWDAMTRRSGWMFDNFAGFRGQLVISQGLVPEGRSEDLPACARGEYDEHFRDFGKLMILKGRGDSILRLGWEFNGDFMPWAATDTQVWKSCYRRAALAIRSVCPRVKFDWTINSHGTPPEICDGNSLNCYPGDDVVDIIGIDNYDMSPSAKSEEEFKRIAEEADGLSWVLEFAKKRGKRFSVGEWGIAPTSKFNTTGENPEFIRWMHNWFVAHAADLDYEMYFNECDGGVGTNLRLPEGPSCKRYNPLAARVYRELFGGQDREREPIFDPGMTPLERERVAGEAQKPLAQ